LVIRRRRIDLYVNFKASKVSPWEPFLTSSRISDIITQKRCVLEVVWKGESYVPL
jgi:hypothetical protein